MPLPTPLEETLTHLTWRHADDRKDLIADMRSLAEQLTREAAYLEAEPERQPSSLGVVQQRGRDIDRGCALLCERRTHLETFKRLAKAGVA